jgi:hypothetical protein
MRPVRTYHIIPRVQTSNRLTMLVNERTSVLRTTHLDQLLSRRTVVDRRTTLTIPPRQPPAMPVRLPPRYERKVVERVAPKRPELIAKQPPLRAPPGVHRPVTQLRVSLVMTCGKCHGCPPTPTHNPHGGPPVFVNHVPRRIVPPAVVVRQPGNPPPVAVGHPGNPPHVAVGRPGNPPQVAVGHPGRPPHVAVGHPGRPPQVAVGRPAPAPLVPSRITGELPRPVIDRPGLPKQPETPTVRRPGHTPGLIVVRAPVVPLPIMQPPALPPLPPQVQGPDRPLLPPPWLMTQQDGPIPSLLDSPGELPPDMPEATPKKKRRPGLVSRPAPRPVVVPARPTPFLTRELATGPVASLFGPPAVPSLRSELPQSPGLIETEDEAAEGRPARTINYSIAPEDVTREPELPPLDVRPSGSLYQLALQPALEEDEAPAARPASTGGSSLDLALREPPLPPLPEREQP